MTRVCAPAYLGAVLEALGSWVSMAQVPGVGDPAPVVARILRRPAPGDHRGSALLSRLEGAFAAMRTAMAEVGAPAEDLTAVLECEASPQAAVAWACSGAACDPPEVRERAKLQYALTGLLERAAVRRADAADGVRACAIRRHVSQHGDVTNAVLTAAEGADGEGAMSDDAIGVLLQTRLGIAMGVEVGVQDPVCWLCQAKLTGLAAGDDAAHPLACPRMLPMHEEVVHDRVVRELEAICRRAGWCVQHSVTTVLGRRLDAVVEVPAADTMLGIDVRVTALTTPANVARVAAGGDPLAAAEREKLADAGQGGAARAQAKVMAPVVLSVVGGMGDATRVLLAQLTMALSCRGWWAGRRPWQAGPSVGARLAQAMAEGLAVKVRRWRAASLAGANGASAAVVDDIIMGRRGVV